MSNATSRPPFAVQKVFLETAFEQRFQGILRHAWRNRSWHVIAALPGSGKSLGIQDLLLRSGAHKDATGTTLLPILAIRAPKNTTQEQALGVALSAAFGTVPTMQWQVRRTWLVKVMASAQVVGQRERPLLAASFCLHVQVVDSDPGLHTIRTAAA